MVENGSHPKGKFQEKFQEFQKDCRVSEEVLEEVIRRNETAFRNRAANDILAKLEEGSQAQKNLCFILNIYPSAISIFLANQDPKLPSRIRYGQLSDFLARLAQNAPAPTKTTVQNAPEILKEIITDLLDLFETELFNRGVNKNDTDKLKETIFDLLEELINTSQLLLKDPITQVKEPSKIYDGIILFLRYHINFLNTYEFNFAPAGAVENQITNLLKDRICGDTVFPPQSVIEILKPGAPDSLWEVACLQAGILECLWEKKNHD